ncbi:MAG: L-isoaspartyl protein carboxyl methyltransferase [Patescibacteria group bacterium]|nr:L-isoaspartyl protein carboxyl methyltransferase [Patescibacteria group bacterium]
MLNKKDLLKKLKNHGFAPKIITAFDKVERRHFVLPEYEGLAYEDSALPIGQGQTISQPYTIAFMLALLEIKDRQKILEVGSGSGYVLALLKELSKNSQIFGTEIVKELTERSQVVLSKEKNIKIIHTPKSLGLAKQAPFERILVSAAASEMPQPLLKQLSDDAIMVCPINNSIVKITKQAGQIADIREYPGFAFVPLIVEKN